MNLRLLWVAGMLLLWNTNSFAQADGPRPPPQGSPPPGHGHPPGPPPSYPGAGGQPGAPTSFMRGGLQLGPPGRWWDDEGFSHQLGLRPEQQKRMDAIFNENREKLATGYQALRREEQEMEGLSRASNLDEAALTNEIDRIAQARATLEKANTHYLIQVRRVLDPDQITRLEAHR